MASIEAEIETLHRATRSMHETAALISSWTRQGISSL